MYIEILFIFLLVLFSAFFSAAETCYTTVSKNRLKALADKDGGLAKLALHLTENFDQLLSTILIGNNIVNLAASSLCTVLFITHYGEKLGATLATITITVILLLFGEITPKSISHEYAERLALPFSPILWLFIKLFLPINILFVWWKKFVGKLLKFKQPPPMSQEELLLLVDEVQNDGSIDKDESALLKNAIKFTECRAEDIITHRVDIAALPITATKNDVAAKFDETEYSRLPVYSENIDNIVGVVVLRDFYDSLKHQPWDFSKVLSKPFFIQKTEKIDEVLKKLQLSQSQIAIVLDEFGGTLGILTMEDILEELVGEIWDEHDEVVEKFQKLSEDYYTVDCTVGLDEFQEYFHLQLESSEPMLSGWILEQLQKIPQKGDHFTIPGMEFTVSACSHHRLRRVDIRLLPPPDEANDNGENDASQGTGN